MSIFQRIGRFLLDAIETIVMALALFVIMYLFLFQPHQVRGNSMYPNFYDKEYLLTDKITYKLTPPKRGEVVIFKAPRNEEYDYIKRIIGLPGDMVGIRDAQIYVNNKLLKEDYLPEEIKTTGGLFLKEGQTVPVPENTFFVLGDNRSHSSDSRDWGPVPKDNIIGKAWLRYWPIDKVGIVPKVKYSGFWSLKSASVNILKPRFSYLWGPM